MQIKTVEMFRADGYRIVVNESDVQQFLNSGFTTNKPEPKIEPKKIKKVKS